MPNYLGITVSVNALGEYRKKVTLESFKENNYVNTNSIKKFLFKNGLKERKCEICGWCEININGGNVPIELHHINGDNSDNRLENLQILCPNHHSLTENYRSRNSKKRIVKNDYLKNKIKDLRQKTNSCKWCGKPARYTYCSKDCCCKSTRRANRPDLDTLLKEVNELGFVGTGRKYGVSDNAIRKWLKSTS